jgi:type IV pilus assembly protein PilE
MLSNEEARMESFPRRRHAAGVTLVELLTVVVIVAILASIAVPSYRAYLVRTNRSDAKTALLQLQAAQEKYYLQANKYADNVTAKPPAGLGLPEVTQNGYYKISVELKNVDQGYKATAAPIPNAGQDDDRACGSFYLTDSGGRTVSATGANANTTCWK